MSTSFDRLLLHRSEALQLRSRNSLLIAAFVLLTSAVLLATAYYEPMRLDELLEIQTDSVSSVQALLQVQRSYPISLDPLVYHLFAHGSMRALGVGAFALRVPSILGFLLMQLSLCAIVRAVATNRAAVFAVAFPALTLAMYFAPEGRPYGLELGFFALTMALWQSVTRRESGRTVLLASLAIAIALALNTHYFGILLLIPVYGAELVRTTRNRRLDLPVVLSIFLGTAGIVFTLPFMKAAREFRQNYYNLSSLNIGFIPRAYSNFLVVVHTAKAVNPAVVVLLLAVAVLLVWQCTRLKRAGTILLPDAEFVFLILLAMLPVFGYLLAAFVTHSIEVRFVLGGVIGITALLSIAVSPLLRASTAGIVFALLFLVTAGRGVHIIQMDRQADKKIASSMRPTPELQRALLASPGDPAIYIQDLRLFDLVTYYQHDPDVLARIRLVYSRDQELRWTHADTITLTALHMGRFTAFKTVPFASIASTPGPHIFVKLADDLDWTEQALGAADAHVEPLGALFGGQALSASFAPGSGQALHP